MEKLDRKKSQKVETSKIARYETCFSCKNPRSNICDNQMCRRCCRDKTFSENSECKGKHFYSNCLIFSLFTEWTLPIESNQNKSPLSNNFYKINTETCT